MSFLSQLTASSFGAPLTLRPKLPSLFEPRRRESSPAAQVRESAGQRKRMREQEVTTNADAKSEQAPVEASDSSRSAHLRRTLRAAPHESAEEGERVRVREGAEHDEAEVHGPPKAVEALRDVEPAKPLPGPVAAALARPGTRIMEVVREVEAAPRTKDDVTVRAVVTPVQRALDIAVPRAISPAPVSLDRKGQKVMPRRPEETVGTLLPGAMRSLGPQVAERAPMTPLPVRRERTQAAERGRVDDGAERSVHISIGRVDIVAEVQPAVHRRPQQKAAAGITLEEYLRRKSARGSA